MPLLHGMFYLVLRTFSLRKDHHSFRSAQFGAQPKQLGQWRQGTGRDDIRPQIADLLNALRTNIAGNTNGPRRLNQKGRLSLVQFDQNNPHLRTKRLRNDRNDHAGKSATTSYIDPNP